ncbi:MAG: hemerythrin domain-containing protein [bacterium]
MYIRDDKITIQMIKNHAVLDLSINKIVNGVNMPKSTRIKQFKKFKENILAHFLVEEGSVFGFTAFTNSKIMQTIRGLLKEHAEMKRLVELIEDDLRNDLDDHLGEFIKLMYKHQVVENTVFYPYLDKELPPEQREQVLANIKQLL